MAETDTEAAKTGAILPPVEDFTVDRSKMSVSDEVAIEISSMNKWFGDFHVLRTSI
jgi:hypothetical protein